MQSKQRVFISGGSGILGSKLAQELIRSGYTVASPPSSEANILNLDALCAYATSFAPTTIVHVAAVTHTNDAQEYVDVNVYGTSNMIAAAKACHSDRFIFVSSRAAVLGGGAYAESKVKAEEIVSQSGLAYTIVRPAEVYGGSPKEALAKLSAWITRYHIAPLVGRGDARVAPAHIDDIVTALRSILEHAETIRKTYTLAGPEEITMRELAKRLMYHYKSRALIVPIPITILHMLSTLSQYTNLNLFADDQIKRLLANKSADISAAQADFGYKPIPLELGLAKVSVRI